MSKRQISNQSAEIDRLAQKLAELVEMFRKSGPASSFNWWNSHSAQSIFSTYESYNEGAGTFHKVVQGILKLNPNMLSGRELEQNLQYEFLANQVISQEHFGQGELEQKAREHLTELLEPNYQDVDIPIANLQFDSPRFKLGHVTLMPIADQHQNPWAHSTFVPAGIRRNIHMFARVHAPGFKHMAYEYALSQTRLVMEVLRAFCFPLNPEKVDRWQVGIVGDTVFYMTIPLRVNNQFETALLGPAPIANLEFRSRLLSRLEQQQWDEINCLIQKGEHSRRPMENKLLDGIHWLAEATLPDSYRTRFAKIAFALETLLGGEPKETEDLKTKGITAMLAERATFIAGQNFGDRVDIDNNIRKYYGMRSDIVHGSGKDISADDIEGFGILVRRLALALLTRLNEPGNKLDSVDNLASWIKTQRYTLPEQS